jgi:hypothetical protein
MDTRMTDAATLPPGFTLDPPKPNATLPPGYTLDPPQPPPDQGSALTAIQNWSAAHPNAASTSTPADSDSGGFVKWLESLASGAGRGVFETPGIVGDLINLGALGGGKLAGLISPEVGQEIQNWAREGLSGQGGLNIGTARIDEWLDRAGVLQKPTGGSDTAYTIGGVLGNTIGGGMTGPIRAGVGAGIKALARGAVGDIREQVARATAERVAAEYTPTAIARNAVQGAGAGAGMVGAQDALHAAGMDQNPYVDAGLGLAGAVVGGGLGSRGASLVPGLSGATKTQQQLIDDFKIMNTRPALSSDVGGTGLVSNLVSKVLPTRFGAQNISEGSAQRMMAGVGKYTQDQLDFAKTPSLTEQGEKMVALQGQDRRAWEDQGLHNPGRIPASSVDLPTQLASETNRASGTFGDLLKVAPDETMPPRSYEPRYVPRDVVGDPAKLETWAKQEDALRASDIPHSVADLADPAPTGWPKPGFSEDDESWMQGATKSDLVKWFLSNAARGPDGQFNFDQLMRFWQSRSADTQQAIKEEAPEMGAVMARLGRVYEATQNSRSLLTGKERTAMTDPATVLSFGLGLTSHPAGLAEPLFMGTGAFLTQRIPGMPRYLATSGTDLGNIVAGQERAEVPPMFWTPPPKPEQQQSSSAQPAPGQKVEQWAVTATQPQVTAYVSSKLGPQVAMQLGQNYRAGLLQLMSDPNYRRALQPPSA